MVDAVLGDFDHSCFLYLQAISQYLAACQHGRAAHDYYSLYIPCADLPRGRTFHASAYAAFLLCDGFRAQLRPVDGSAVLIPDTPVLHVAPHAACKGTGELYDYRRRGSRADADQGAAEQ